MTAKSNDKTGSKINIFNALNLDKNSLSIQQPHQKQPQ